MYNIYRIQSVGGSSSSSRSSNNISRCSSRSNGISSITLNGICTCILQLLVALQMLMTFEMPLSTTMALPVTSKPIESTAENLAWQAWLMLPPEQKQLIKSRKVTPKSIFTIPLRVDCPEGHQQVDTKCIPTVIGSNAVLIDPNVLGLVLGGGNSPSDVEYDYEDEVMAGDGGMGGDNSQTKMELMPYNPPLHLKDPVAEESAKDELRPPSADEPLKFNIFQSTFPTDDYALEDYSSVSNEGSASGGQTHEMPIMPNVNETIKISFNISTTNIEKDLVSEASSNISKVHSFTTLPDSNDFNLDDIDAISLPASGGSGGGGREESTSHKISLFKEDSSLHLVTSDMEPETARVDAKEYEITQAMKENDLMALLQTESLMPLMEEPLKKPLNLSDTKQQEESSTDSSLVFDLNMGNGGGVEVTTLPNMIEKQKDPMPLQDKVEFIRSVTMNPQTSDVTDVNYVVDETTLTSTKNVDELSGEESGMTTITETPIQLDETTIIESNDESFTTTTAATLSTDTLSTSFELLTSASSLSPSVAAALPSETPMPTKSTAASEELTTLLWQQEQALKDFEELQRLRKGQLNDQHLVMKKSKVEPVRVAANDHANNLNQEAQTSEATTPPTAATATTNVMDELMTVTEMVTEMETELTPLLSGNNSRSSNSSNNNNNNTVIDHNDDSNQNNNNNNNNNKNNNDRFYYQHIGKQDLESQYDQPSSTLMPPTDIKILASPPTTSATTTTTTLGSATTVNGGDTTITSEIDLAQELRLINDLVKGSKRSNGIVTSTKATTLASATTTPSTITTTVRPLPVFASSESSVNFIKQQQTADIWSKIMPLLQTTAIPYKTTTTTTGAAVTAPTGESLSTTLAGEEMETSTAATTAAVVSNRSHRNSKIIRINGFNTINATPPTEVVDTTTSRNTRKITATTTTTAEEQTKSPTTTTEENLTTKNPSTDDSYESFWWLPVSWRTTAEATTTRTTTTKPEQNESNSEEKSLLLRFWSAYHAPKSS